MRRRRVEREPAQLLVKVILAAAFGVALIAPGAASAQSFSASGSAEQVYAVGLAPRARVLLITPAGRTLQRKRADSLGGILFRNVPPGSGYRVRVASNGSESPALTVHSDAAAPWDPSVYNQQISDNGYQYLTTRDGTKLAIDVHPPTSPAGEPGLPPPFGIPQLPVPKGLPSLPFAPPYPTLIEYSGYGYANPAGPTNGIAVLANLMGFAVVDVNMRGTGCSGGAFDFFEPLQNLDGYDVIETIARQPWVLDHKVGMMGISYGGISQLFTAQLDPPALEAIAPLSVLDATATTLYPGGDLNDGFAVAWAKARQYEARPAGPNGGQPWAYKQIQNGDQTCKQNQALHEEAADLMAKIHANSHYKPRIADPLDPVTFVNKITVPTYMACQWEDEQTGGHCPELVQHFTGARLKWFTFTNGAHIDSLDPYTYNRWYDFLQLFVAHKAPIEDAALTQAAAPVIYQSAMGINDNVVTLPPDPIQRIPTYSAALAAFEKLPPVRVMFDNGAGAWPPGQQHPGDPYPAFEQSFPSLPVPGTTAGYWYLGPGGALGTQPPSGEGVNTYESNPKALPPNDYPANGNTSTGGLWGDAPEWQWDWKQNPAGTAVSYISAPLQQNATVIGPGEVRVWVRSAARDVDLQASVTEVRPDGNETFVQNGWIRASERKLSTGTNNMFKQASTVLAPIPTFTPADARPTPKGRFVEVTIPLYFEGHVYRAGSRIRVVIAAPNGTQPIWSFGHTRPGHGQTKVWIAFSRAMPSALILPIVPGVSVPTGLPPCPGLRNEPCRPYVAFSNQVASVPRSTRRHKRSRSGASTNRRRTAPPFAG